MKEIATLKSYFNTGNIPTEAQFFELIDSLWYQSGMIFNAGTYGAISGSVSAAQRTINLAAIHTARDAAIAAGGGEIVINGEIQVNNTVDFSNLGQCRISMRGMGGLNSGSTIRFCGASGTAYAFTLRGTSYFRIDDLTIDANNLANYALHCERDATLVPAGKHSFYNCRFIQGLKASYLNYASEENIHVKCQFQHSPIGVILTALPVVANVEVAGVDPVADWGGARLWNTSHFFYDCGIGDYVDGSRCALLSIGAQAFFYGGIFHAKEAPNSEAYIIIEGTHSQEVGFFGVHLDSGLSAIGIQTGQYAPSTIDHVNRLRVIGCHLTIHQAAPIGTAFIKAKNMRASLIGPITVAGPGAGIGIELEDANCTDNIFMSCLYSDGTALTINDAAAAPTNIVISDGKVKFLAGSVAGADLSLHHSTVSERLQLTGGGFTVTPTAEANLGFNMVTVGDTSSRMALAGSGAFSWGPGDAAPDTTLYRTAANHLRTGDMFTATDGLVTKVIADVPEDADFTAAPASGLIAIDSANNRIYVRVGTTWKYAALT